MTGPFRRITVIDAHPDKHSYCAGLAGSYVDGAQEAGHPLRQIVLRDLSFDPVLRRVEGEPQPLESCLEAAEEAIRWSQHLVIVTPCWHWSIPALFKGFLDRVFRPGFSVNYQPHFPYKVPLLTGRSARVVYTQSSSQWLAMIARRDIFWVYMRRAVLGHCGFSPVRRTLISRVHTLSAAQRRERLSEVQDLGRRGL